MVGLLSACLEYGITSALGVNDMHGASEARVERVHGTKHLHLLPRLTDWSLKERGFVSTSVDFGIAWPCVPGCRPHRLIVLDLLILDLDQMGKGNARHVVEAEA